MKASSRPDWAAIIASFAGRRVIVIGDVMLDEYVSGDARRVCPEAPVPVVEATERWAVPGGAGNAAANVAALGGQPALGGVTGDDPAAAILNRAVRAAGIDAAGLVADPSRPTTTKLRVLARGQQVIRVDTECAVPIPSGPAQLLTNWAVRTTPESDALLLSDYGKGVIDSHLAGEVIAAARRSGRPVVVDPKGHAPERYRGATVIKPNASELADLTGLPTRTSSEVMIAGRRLAEMLEGTTVLVTRGSDGLVLFRAGVPGQELLPSIARRVFDVTGAGDTVAAALTLGLAAGLSIEMAARIANAAAGIAVCKVGTSVVSPDELIASLLAAIPDVRTERSESGGHGHSLGTRTEA